MPCRNSKHHNQARLNRLTRAVSPARVKREIEPEPAWSSPGAFQTHGRHAPCALEAHSRRTGGAFKTHYAPDRDVLFFEQNLGHPCSNLYIITDAIELAWLMSPSLQGLPKHFNPTLNNLLHQIPMNSSTSQHQPTSNPNTCLT